MNDLFFDTNIDNYEQMQSKISEIIAQYNEIITQLDNINKLLKGRVSYFALKFLPASDNNELDLAQYSFYKKSRLGAYIPETDPTVKEHLIFREYGHMEELVDGIRDCVNDLIGLVPFPLNNSHVNKSLTHRNNLFLASGLLGFINMKNIDFNLKYNSFVNVKLSLYNLLGNNKNKLEFYDKTNNLLLEYFRSVSIFDTSDINPQALASINTKTNDAISTLTNPTKYVEMKKFIEFLNKKNNLIIK